MEHKMFSIFAGIIIIMLMLILPFYPRIDTIGKQPAFSPETNSVLSTVRIK